MNELIVGQGLYFEAKQREFCYYIKERQAIYYRRHILEQTYPWTEDLILQQQRFSNVYRCLDPSSQKISQWIINQSWTKEDHLLNIMAYRVLGGFKVWGPIGVFRTQKSCDEVSIAASLKELRDRKPEVFRSTRSVGTNRGLGTSDRLQGLARIISLVAANCSDLVSELERANSAEAMWKIIKKQKGFGVGLAYQVVVDLLTPRWGIEKSLFLNPECADTFYCLISKQMEEQAEILTGTDDLSSQESQINQLRRKLSALIEDNFYQWHGLKSYDDSDIRLSLPDMIQCLHEFYRYQGYKHRRSPWQRHYYPPEAEGG